MFFQSINLNEMVMCLEDLINYFAQPADDMGNNPFEKISFGLFIYIFFCISKQNMKRNKIVSVLYGIARIYFRKKAFSI